MPKFVLYRDVARFFRWRFVASNSEIVAHGESYVSKQGALDAISFIKRFASGAPIEDLT